MSEDLKKLKQIKRELESILKDKVNINALGREEIEYYEKLLEGLNKTSGKLKDYQNLQDTINKSIQDATKEVFELRGAIAASVDEMQGLNAGINRSNKALRGLESIASKLANDQADITRLNLKDLKTQQQKLAQNKVNFKIAQDTLKREKDSLEFKKSKGELEGKEEKRLLKIQEHLQSINAELDKESSINSKLQKIVEARITQEDMLNKKIGAAPQILEGIGKSLQKLGLPDFGVSEAVDEAKNVLRLKDDEFKATSKLKKEKISSLETELKQAKAQKKSKGEIKEITKRLKKAHQIEEERVTSTMALSEVTGQLGKKLKDQLTISNLIQSSIAALMSAMSKIDKITGNQAKNLGLSYDESLAMVSNFNQIALNSDNIMVSTSSLEKSFTSLNQRFQGSTGFTNEMLESFTALTKQAGISEETVSNIAVITGTQGEGLKSNIALMQGQLEVMNEQEGTSFNSFQTLEDIGKVSKATLLTLRNQPKALARTLMTSKKLVLSFAEMESISSSLLDFEGSIQAELEAELLTGKQINLEQARLLALKGDIAGASAEVAKQIGSAADFERMNVIQQEALAKAAGLTREQLANSLIEREALARLGGQDKTALEAYNRLKEKGLSDEQIAIELGDKRLAAQLKSQSVQERFAAAIERIQELFVDVGTALMPIVSGIADAFVGVSKLLGYLSPILKPLMIIYGIFKGIHLLVSGIGRGLKLIGKISKINLGTKLSELKTQLGIDNLMKKGFMKAKAAHALNKLGLLTNKQAAFWKGRVTHFEMQKLGLSKKNLGMENASLMTSIKNTAQKRLQNIFGKEGLVQSFARNAAERINNTLTAIGLGFNRENLIVKGAIFLKEEALNALKVIGNALGLTSLGTTVAEGAAETVITTNKTAQNRSMVGIIAKGLVNLGILVAQAAAAITKISVETLGIGTIIGLAAAAAGIAVLYAMTRPKKAGDIMGNADGKTQVSTAEGGLFELSKNDQFVAAPGIADAAKASNKAKTNAAQQQSNVIVQQNNDKLEKSIQQTNQILTVVSQKFNPKPILGSEINNSTYIAASGLN
tara:strand:+ start:12873 stop:16040 length:3168 start_codon:yes stop_codon:yes gene_type:complete